MWGGGEDAGLVVFPIRRNLVVLRAGDDNVGLSVVVKQDWVPNPRKRDAARARAIRPNLLNFMRFLHAGPTGGGGQDKL